MRHFDGLKRAGRVVSAELGGPVGLATSKRSTLISLALILIRGCRLIPGR
jgi:hypothetical protein